MRAGLLVGSVHGRLDGRGIAVPAIIAEPAAWKCKDFLDQVGGFAQRLLGQMRIALRGSRMQMPKQALHHIE